MKANSLPKTKIKTVCRHYQGDRPCIYHKKFKVSCENCDYFSALGCRILIIKLGAIGDVIRTTPLLRKIKEQYPRAEISWLTYSPEAISKKWVDNTLGYDLSAVLWLKEQKFDWVINLDKDKGALALCKSIRARRKSGFTLDNFGKCKAISNQAENRKWLTGLRDDLNKINEKNYLEEIFEICGWRFAGEEYILDIENKEWPGLDNTKAIVGLNTGCGARWLTRSWPDHNWEELAKTLKARGYEVLLLGGEQEDEKNKKISAASGAKYFGFFTLKEFFGLVNQCDIVVTQVTMAMHIAIALKKYLVLLNNIFNAKEFYLWGRGIILQPGLDCLACYKNSRDENCKSSNCMELISPDSVLGAIEKSQFKKPPRG